MLRYLDDLSDRLSRLDKGRRVAFACWAAERVWSQGRDALAERVGTDSTESLEMTLRQLSDAARSGEDVQHEALQYWKAVCSGLRWDHDAVEIEEEHQNFLAEEAADAAFHALEAGLTGSAEAAAHAAEKVLNCIDFELQMLRGVDESTEHDLFRAELGLQQRKLLELERNGLAR